MHRVHHNRTGSKWIRRRIVFNREQEENGRHRRRATKKTLSPMLAMQEALTHEQYKNLLLEESASKKARIQISMPVGSGGRTYGSVK